MSLLQTLPPNNRRSAEPGRKPEAFRQEFARLWKQMVSSPYCWVPSLLLGLIVPLFQRQDTPAGNVCIAVLSVVVLLAVISFAILLGTGVLRGARRVKWLLECPHKHSELLAKYDQLERSLPGLAAHVRSDTATQLIALASLDESADEIPIAEIVNLDGTVHFILKLPAGPEVFMGRRLTVSTRTRGDLWGVVEIWRVDGDRGYARPVDRVNRDFWDHLEERMRHDPSAPPGVVVKTELHELVAQLRRAVREEEVTSNE